MTNYKQDINDRTYEFARNTRETLRCYFKEYHLRNDIFQVIRSSGSVAANNIEAQESTGEKDKIYRFRLCRKEAKESILWLRLLNNSLKDKKIEFLENEAVELVKIFSAIISKLSNK